MNKDYNKLIASEVKVHGIMLWQVHLNGVLVAQAWSEGGAIAMAYRKLNKALRSK